MTKLFLFLSPSSRVRGLWRMTWSVVLLLVQAGPTIGQTDEEMEQVFWQSVECKSARQVQAYLEVYPTGRYLAEAWGCLEGQLGLGREERRLAQQGLAAVGYDPGPTDGLFGAKPSTRTRQAIRAWQEAKGMEASGYLTREQADALIALGKEAQEAGQLAQAERTAEEAAARQAREADDAAYAEAQRTDTATAYGAYLVAYPQGRHVDEARQAAHAATTREEIARQAADDAAYAQAQRLDTAAAYEAYLATYPTGRYADRARQWQEEHQAQADDAAYAEAQRVDTAEAYGAYLAVYPTGRHAQEARERQARPQWQVGQTFSDELQSGGKGPEMVVVPAGSFMMGCVSGRDCQDNEQPAHQVTIEWPFAVGVYEVTFAEYDRFASTTGWERSDDEGDGRGRRPVINIAWEDAVAYTQWLSKETGRGYRLLSEAEWEYAARAGTTTRYWWGNEIGRNRANCNDCGSQWTESTIFLYPFSGETAPVGSFEANAFRLYDAHGNVWEWVQDCWNNSYAGAPSDGRAWESGDCSRRVLRGGSWNDTPGYLRSAHRRYTADTRFNNPVGFRIARNLD